MNIVRVLLTLNTSLNSINTRVLVTLQNGITENLSEFADSRHESNAEIRLQSFRE